MWSKSRCKGDNSVPFPQIHHPEHCVINETEKMGFSMNEQLHSRVVNTLRLVSLTEACEKEPLRLRKCRHHPLDCTAQQSCHQTGNRLKCKAQSER